MYAHGLKCEYTLETCSMSSQENTILQNYIITPQIQTWQQQIHFVFSAMPSRTCSEKSATFQNRVTSKNTAQITRTSLPFYVKILWTASEIMCLWWPLCCQSYQQFPLSSLAKVGRQLGMLHLLPVNIPFQFLLSQLIWFHFPLNLFQHYVMCDMNSKPDFCLWLNDLCSSLVWPLWLTGS